MKLCQKMTYQALGKTSDTRNESGDDGLTIRVESHHF